MPAHTCANCAHWRKTKAGSRAEGMGLGECHAKPPTTHFGFPRTKETDDCGEHSAHHAASFATAHVEAEPARPLTEMELAIKAGAKPGDAIPTKPTRKRG